MYVIHCFRLVLVVLVAVANSEHLLQVSAENMIGLQEPTKVSMIAKVFFSPWASIQHWHSYHRLGYFITILKIRLCD